MKKVTLLCSVILASCVVATSFINTDSPSSQWGTQIVHAEGLDDVKRGNNSNSNNDSYDAVEDAQNRQNIQDNGNNADIGKIREYTSTDGIDSGIGGFIKSNVFGLKQENLQNASVLLSPITSILVSIASLIVVLIFVFQVLQTAVDMMYIYIPFTRRWLAPQNIQGTGGTGMMGGGFGGGYGGFGGMMNQSPQQDGASGGRQIVTDECLQAIAMGGNTTAQSGINGGQMMGGFGMGGMGMGMGAMQPQQQPKLRSIAYQYLKLRAFALAFLGIMSVLLFSSVFFDFGINFGMMLLKFAYQIMGVLGW